MPQLITYGNELIRINPVNNHIEYSTNRGISWISRYSGSSCGTFRDLVPYNVIVYVHYTGRLIDGTVFDTTEGESLPHSS